MLEEEFIPKQGDDNNYSQNIMIISILQKCGKYLNDYYHHPVLEEITTDIIPLQLEKLKALTHHSNGRLILMTHDNSDVNRVNNYIKHNLVIVDDNSSPWHDSGYPFVFVVAAIFLFWFRKGWTLQW